MLTKDVVSYFGGRPQAAKAIGITRMAVWQWGDIVPASSALEYHKVTQGKLRFDPATYITVGRKRRKAASRRQSKKSA